MQSLKLFFLAISWWEQVNFKWDQLCTRPTCLVGFL